MSAFNLEISYPVNVDGTNKSIVLAQSENEILQAFDALRWRQYRILQLQLNGSKTTMNISNLEIEHSFTINLLTMSESGNIEVSIDTDIAVFTSKKDMFGLLNRKIKRYIRFERLDLVQAREYLALFMTLKLEDLEQEYKQHSTKIASAV